MTKRDVAVVVPTHNRPELLLRCVQTVVQQEPPPSEVVVVDDGSAVPADTALAGLDAPACVAPRVIRHGRARGPAQARNVGWRATTADYIAFTDDDCTAAPGWLGALRSAAAPDRVVVGRTAPDPTEGPIRSPLERSMRVDAEDGRFSTCNILYPRTLLEALDGFDDSFGMPYGEDTDLGQRALDLGARAVYAADAVILHAVHRMGLRATLRERRRVGEMAGLMRRHPRLRRSAGHEGLWLTRDHRLAVLAVAGLAAVPLTPAGLGFAGRWGEVAATERIQEWPGSPRWRTLALLALLDAAEVVACLQGSVRHRSLLL
jgi:glycosyltransferase involved in cell wall biosynthesis